MEIDFPRAWFHMTARGNERRTIFRTDGDRRKWINLLAELPPRYLVLIHGYALMPNHFAIPLSSANRFR